jgi:hypothetical protein
MNQFILVFLHGVPSLGVVIEVEGAQSQSHDGVDPPKGTRQQTRVTVRAIEQLKHRLMSAGVDGHRVGSRAIRERRAAVALLSRISGAYRCDVTGIGLLFPPRPEWALRFTPPGEAWRHLNAFRRRRGEGSRESPVQTIFGAVNPRPTCVSTPIIQRKMPYVLRALLWEDRR